MEFKISLKRVVQESPTDQDCSTRGKGRCLNRPRPTVSRREVAKVHTRELNKEFVAGSFQTSSNNNKRYDTFIYIKMCCHGD